jgi:hypothetical protein
MKSIIKSIFRADLEAVRQETTSVRPWGRSWSDSMLRPLGTRSKTIQTETQAFQPCLNLKPWPASDVVEEGETP